MGWLFAFCSVLLVSAAQLLLKWAMVQLPPLGQTGLFVDTLFTLSWPVLALSGGERARALLARVLAGEPELLLADEPLANLDPRHAVDALRLFRNAADAGAAVVLVLHDLQAAARVADRLLLLADGRCLAQGAPAEVLTPARLAAAYGLQMLVRADPETGLIIAPKVV